MRGGPNSKGALAALGLAGIVWAFKNRDMIGKKLNQYRGQMQEQQGRSFDSFNKPSTTPFSSDLSNNSSLGDNYNKNI